MPAASKKKSIRVENQYRLETVASVTVAPLIADEREEALEFLAVRPLHTVIMSGWIRDNGIISPLNKGTFYGCRDAEGRLVGVAFIGKNTLFEVRTNEALQALAQRASECPDIRMVMAEGEKLSKFWRYYAKHDQPSRLKCNELLIEKRQVVKGCNTTSEVRLATRKDLNKVVAIHARMVFEETGVNPLATDSEGFRMRCAARVNQGRVWVWIKNGELIFKADIISDTPEAIYFEGLWVNPKQRGKGFGKLCLVSLCQRLLNRSNAICGFVDAENLAAQALYRQTGFSFRDTYTKVYL